MVLLVADWIYSKGCVLFSSCSKEDTLQHTACVSVIIFPRFSFQGLLHTPVYPISLVFCAVGSRRLSLTFPRQPQPISDMLQEPSQQLLGAMDDWVEVVETVMLLKWLMQEKGILSRVKPNGEWEEIESEVLNTQREGNFKHFFFLFCRNKYNSVITCDVWREQVWMWVSVSECVSITYVLQIFFSLLVCSGHFIQFFC